MHELLGGARLEYWPSFLSTTEQAQLYEELHAGLALRVLPVRVFGRLHKQPRETSWHAPGSYSYSGLTLEPQPWTPELHELRERIRQHCGMDFPSVLVNHYRDGSDRMGWHADDEPELGEDPVIASLSLGATRRFRLKHKQQKQAKHSLDLEGGSLLLMDGATQRHWLHSLPATKKPVGGRLNLTWRPWVTKTSSRPAT
ncbi:MAG: alpha-ketoglutarate-dependent dioxygenase AlkB [Planctomycetota bacterium]|nr:MAG: alpha-ketoglutarate-dependent dioxygenase AlkB [Planctomycetota bacterium]